MPRLLRHDFVDEPATNRPVGMHEMIVTVVAVDVTVVHDVFVDEIVLNKKKNLGSRCPGCLTCLTSFNVK